MTRGLGESTFLSYLRIRVVIGLVAGAAIGIVVLSLFFPDATLRTVCKVEFTAAILGAVIVVAVWPPSRG